MRPQRYPYSGKKKEPTQLRVDPIVLQKLESSSIVTSLQTEQLAMKSAISVLRSHLNL